MVFSQFGSVAGRAFHTTPVKHREQQPHLKIAVKELEDHIHVQRLGEQRKELHLVCGRALRHYILNQD